MKVKSVAQGWCVLAIAVASCQGADDRSSTGAADDLLVTASVEVDSVARLLASRQRMLLDGLAADDPAVIANLVDVGFRFYTAPPVRTDSISALQAVQQVERSYFTALAGEVPTYVAEVERIFDVRLLPNGSAAVVSGRGSSTAITTLWMPTSDGWRATMMIPGDLSFPER